MPDEIKEEVQTEPVKAEPTVVKRLLLSILSDGNIHLNCEPDMFRHEQIGILRMVVAALEGRR